MARNPYRDVPREQAKVWFDEIRLYIDGGKIHRKPDAVAHLDEMCERLWGAIPRLTERPTYWLHRALWFENAQIEQFRQEGRVRLNDRRFMSWSRHPRTAINSNGLGLEFGSLTHGVVIVTDYIKALDIFIDVDALGRRAGYRITQFQWNGGEREFIVRHHGPTEYPPDSVQVYQAEHLQAGDFASIRLDRNTDPELLARMKQLMA
jgi:hypothetical protein